MSPLIPHLMLWATAAVAPSLVAAQDRLAVRAGRLVDVDRGEVRRDQVVLIRLGKIEERKTAIAIAAASAAMSKAPAAPRRATGHEAALIATLCCLTTGSMRYPTVPQVKMLR